MSNYKEFKLTQYTKSGGWGAKFSLEDLGQILNLFNLDNKNPNILVDASTKDDAAVYKINDDTCIALTVDFFPPNVDDPYTYGQISAANSMSDIYAMGGNPIIGLNIAAFPKKFPIEIINRILLGAKEKCDEANLSIIGGHTIYDEEPKYGLAVIGTINCNDIKKNNTAKEGDLLILTKPLGTGIITQSIKNNSINAENAINESITSSVKTPPCLRNSRSLSRASRAMWSIPLTLGIPDVSESYRSWSTGSPGWILFLIPSRPARSIAAKARYGFAVESGKRTSIRRPFGFET